MGLGGDRDQRRLVPRRAGDAGQWRRHGRAALAGRHPSSMRSSSGSRATSRSPDRSSWRVVDVPSPSSSSRFSWSRSSSCSSCGGSRCLRRIGEDLGGTQGDLHELNAPRQAASIGRPAGSLAVTGRCSPIEDQPVGAHEPPRVRPRVQDELEHAMDVGDADPGAGDRSVLEAMGVPPPVPTTN